MPSGVGKLIFAIILSLLPYTEMLGIEFDLQRRAVGGSVLNDSETEAEQIGYDITDEFQ